MIYRLLIISIVCIHHINCYIPFNPVLTRDGNIYEKRIHGTKHVIGWLEIPHGEKLPQGNRSYDRFFDRILSACKKKEPLSLGDNKPYIEPDSLIYVEPYVSGNTTSFRPINVKKGKIKSIWYSDWYIWCNNYAKKGRTYRGHIDDAYWFEHILPEIGLIGLQPKSNPNASIATLSHAKKYYFPYMLDWARNDDSNNIVFRPWLFYDVMGVTESYFQDVVAQCSYVENPSRQRQTLFPNVFGGINMDASTYFKGRTSVAQTGGFTTSTIRALREYFDNNIRKETYSSYATPVRILDGFKLRKNDSRAIEDVRQTGVNFYIKDDNDNPYRRALRLTDVQYLQQDPDNNGAMFMVASNFNALEGGRGPFNSRLENMIFSPVQGENAALSTMGASILRKYRYHTTYPSNHSPQAGGINLLANIESKKVTTNVHGQVQHMYSPIMAADISDIAIGFHEHAIVTSEFMYPYTRNNAPGYSKIGTDEHYRITCLENLGLLQPGRNPLYLYNNMIPTQLLPQQHVHHIFAAALNLGRKQPYIDTKQDQISAQHILQAAYEGTILQAAEYAHKHNISSQKVYLTLIGTGAFKNDLAWIADILQNNAYIRDAIRDAHLEVYLIIYAGNASDSASSKYDQIRYAVGDLNYALGGYTYPSIARMFDQLYAYVHYLSQQAISAMEQE